MTDKVYARVRENPKFAELCAKRGRYAATMAGITAIVFYAFVLVVALDPQTLGKPVADGSALTVGVVAELLMFALFLTLTGLYVKRANGEFDALTAQVLAEAAKEPRR
ncbi:DUF485 domain-containing protein [Derxia gummosa]|uniref:DUF485 domain-containing protein n=1 Tax=Derxia gummosa DSM 723 TaxID=1121388 RepID=A0A8B6X3G2_9BURK|nr:DUF485 domain-containing protein [Derxia gummosa]